MSEKSEGSLQRPKTRLEEFFRPESRLSSIDKPDFRGGENRGEYCWRVIRHCVKDAIDLVTRSDVRNIQVGHGVHHSRMINHAEPVHDMIYNKLTKEYITLDSRTVRVYLADGRKKDVVTLEENFSQMLHASQPDLFIGWTKGDRKLYLMTNEFEVQSVSNAEGPVSMVVYNENIGEIVTIGPGYLTCWVFRYGGRHILPRRSCHAGLHDHDNFTHMVLEETASRNQKAFAACGTRVAVFNLYEGKLLEWRKELHVRAITAMVFFNPLKYLITAAKDGSIKVWNEKWHLQLVFVGHGGLVTSLAIYPYGPNIMSASKDKTIRVWSLETCDEVDEMKTDDAVESLGTLVNTDNFFSFAGRHGDLWKVKHIHTLHARIGHKVMLLKTTDHPEFPIRTVCLCRDSSVRIVCPANGEVLTTLLMDSRRNLVDAAYAIAEDELYAVFANGDIVKASTATNPCTILDEWKCDDNMKACNYLLVYEYVISADIQGDSWAGITRALDAKGIVSRSSSSRASNRGNRTLLLGGRKDGYICVFDMETGQVEFEIEGHGIKGVLSMIANSKNDQLISCGLDNIIKVWRLYPYAQESLAPLMSFYCAHTPIFMNVMRNKLAVAFQEHTTATYSVVMYNLQTKNRHDHSPEDDHIDAITGLSVCHKLRLSVTSSADGTLHIWNERNNIVRIIKLNATPHSVCFCSHKGDLLVGIGDHIHKVDYKNYMPKSYRTKMISMSFPPAVEEKALPYDDNLLNQMHREDVKRLKAARSSFKFTHFMDILTAEENDEVMREKKLREAAFAKLEARDKEMAKIRDGELEATKKPEHTPVTKREAFEKYLDIFYYRPEAKMPLDQDLESEVKRAMEGPKKKEVESYHPEREPFGFFPPPSQAMPPVPPISRKEKTQLAIEATPQLLEEVEKPVQQKEEPVEKAASPVPPAEPMVPSIRADCYIPNSVLVRLLFPQRSIDEARKKKEEEDSGWKPPTLTAEQLDQIAGQKKKPSMWDSESVLTESSFRDRTLVMDYDDDEDKKKVESKETTMDKTEESPGSSFLSRMNDVLKKSPSPEPEPSNASAFLTEVPGEKEETSLSTSTKPSSRVQASETKTVKKIPTRPTPREPPGGALFPRKTTVDVPPISTVKEPDDIFNIPSFSEVIASRPQVATPPPAPTPLPDFITQFRGAEWFEKYFPNLNENTLPKPWNVSVFVAMLCRVMKISSYEHKVDIMEALKMIHHSEGITDPDPVYSAIYTVLDHHSNPPTCQDPVQKGFIKGSIEMIKELGVYDKTFCVEMIVLFLEADKEIRVMTVDVFKAAGVKDPHNFFQKELDSWDVWSIEDKARPSTLRRMASEWLDKWLTGLRLHIEDVIERMKQGQGIQGRLPTAQLKGSKGVLKKVGLEDLDEDVKAMTVTFDQAPDQSTIDNASHVEGINYFCDMELEKQIERMKKGGQGKLGPDYKNTVLVLPKIGGKAPLVRLGETHTSQCRPSRETALAVDLRLPPVTTRGRQPPPGQLYGFPPCINLPMKPVLMNPFPSIVDAFDPIYQEPLLITLKSSQKYFVHERSYVPPEQEGPG